MYVEIHRIDGDIYVNGDKLMFAVDFTNPPSTKSSFVNVDWLLGWAKTGLESQGHKVPRFAARPVSEFEANAAGAVAPAVPEKKEGSAA